MRRLLCLPLAILFLANGIPTYAQEVEPAVTEVEVMEGSPLVVECELRVEQRPEWKLNGSAPPGDMREAGERVPGHADLVARLRSASARRHHAGLYTCARDAQRAVRVRVLVPAPKPPETTNVAAAVTVAPAAPASSEPTVPLVFKSFELGSRFTLDCKLKAGNDGIEFRWKKNGTVVEEWSDLKNRYEIMKNGTFYMKERSNENDFGNYTCGPQGSGDEVGYQVHARSHARLSSDINVVEGQKLKLQCQLIGKPYPPVTWTFTNATQNATNVVDALGPERVKLNISDQGVENALLVVDVIRLDDAGVYTCTPDATPPLENHVPSSTTLRVKGMYAALWPFLGICAEVFVLCAIILVYEKRRTKPELDDSDTDNHDQKKS